MNLTELEKKLLAAARKHTPSERVPYAFEQRILTRLGERPALDAAALWARALWRAAASCVALVAVVGALVFLTSAQASASVESASVDLAQQFESTLLAAAEQAAEPN